MRCHHIAVCGFIPPDILDHIARNGDQKQQDRARHALEASAEMRGERRALGAIPGLLAVAPGGKRRTVYDAKKTRDLPGTVVRGEGNPASKDPAVNEAYEGSGKTYDFYKAVYGRNSIDDHGLRLDSSVHFGVAFSNALWNGKQMVYGDGDDKLFNRFTRSLDVIGHELTHGVTQYSAALPYHDEPGALNESFSDVFGILMKQWTLKQTAAKSDWLVGEGIFTKQVHGVAIRSFKAPGTAYDDKVLGKDPQPAHMKDYKHIQTDAGGVHTNSGIPNHAFYLLATMLGGKAWEVAGKIWYVTLTQKLHGETSFQQCADATYKTAAELFGAGAAPQQAVLQAWKGVGIDISAALVAAGPKLTVKKPEVVAFEPPGAAAEVPNLDVTAPRRRLSVK